MHIRVYVRGGGVGHNEVHNKVIDTCCRYGPASPFTTPTAVVLFCRAVTYHAARYNITYSEHIQVTGKVYVTLYRYINGMQLLENGDLSHEVRFELNPFPVSLYYIPERYRAGTSSLIFFSPLTHLSPPLFCPKILHHTLENHVILLPIQQPGCS